MTTNAKPTLADWLGALLVPVVLFGSLAASLMTDNGLWFIFGYPVAMMVLGYIDIDRVRGKGAFLLGLSFFILAEIVYWRVEVGP